MKFKNITNNNPNNFKNVNLKMITLISVYKEVVTILQVVKLTLTYLKNVKKDERMITVIIYINKINYYHNVYIIMYY